MYVNDAAYESNCITGSSGNKFYTNGNTSYDLGTFYINIAQIDAKVGDTIQPEYQVVGLSVLLREKNNNLE